MRKVLFACVGNSFRSQIAEGFGRAYAGPGTVEVRSGGTNPSGIVHPAAIRLMREKGIDIAGQHSKLLDLEFAAKADAFVTLCGPLDDQCPRPLAQRVVDWSMEDPVGASEDEQRRVRDAIEAKVVHLYSQWGVLARSSI